METPTHVDILVTQARHEEKLDAIREDMGELKELFKENIVSTEGYREKTNARITVLESFKARATGAYAALAAFVMVAGTYLGLIKPH